MKQSRSSCRNTWAVFAVLSALGLVNLFCGGGGGGGGEAAAPTAGTPLSFTGTEGGANPASQPITARNVSGAQVAWNCAASSAKPADRVAPTWLALSATSGTSDVGGTVTITVSISLTGLTAGTYTATISLSPASSFDLSSWAVTVTVQASGVAPGTATITGKVTDPAGAAVSGAYVSTDKSVLTNTDASGNFSLAVSAPNTYLLRASYSGYDTTTIKEVAVTAGATVSAGTIALGTLAPGTNPFVGSIRCNQCHAAMYTPWKTTGHNLSLRRTQDSPGLPIQVESDFLASLNLSTTSAFSAYGANAPVLSYNSTTDTYSVGIGAVTYPVWITYGGTNRWKQRYLTRIGESFYPLPFQFNDAASTQSYGTYHTSDWYDGSKNPLYASAATLATDVDKADSFERRCAGCHVTGGKYTYNASTGWTASFVEWNIGCEKCHGPGGRHAGGVYSDIINPATFVAARQVELCGQCHSRGTGGKVTGAPSGCSFPFNETQQRDYRPGDELSTLYTYNTDPGEYWGLGEIESTPSRRDGVLHGDPGTNLLQTLALTTPPAFIASSGHHQQILDLYNGPHAPDTTNDPTCFTCHDPHGSGESFLIRTSISSGGTIVPTRANDNTLCLACHAGMSGPFASVTTTDVTNAYYGTVSSALSGAVLSHMGSEVLMGNLTYNPTGTGVGRCTSCHMPMMAKSGAWGTDQAGLKAGDVHSHTFRVVFPWARLDWTNTSFNSMPNSCTTCHPKTGTFAEAWQWSLSGHADIRADHWTYCSGTDRASCVQCHSGKGYVSSIADGEGGKLGGTESSATFNNEFKIHSCYTCHLPTPSAPHARRAITAVRFPSNVVLNAPADISADNALCASCHQFRAGPTSSGIGSAPYKAVNPHYAGAAAILYGSDVDMGYEYAGKTYVGKQTFHVGFGGCVACHMGTPDAGAVVGGHTMNMVHGTTQNIGVCTPCHIGATTVESIRWNTGAGTNWDGSGTTTPVHTVVENLKTALLTEIQALGVTHTASYPYWSPSSGGVWDGANGQALSRAVFDYMLAEKDPGAAYHNARYIMELLIDSIENLRKIANPAYTWPYNRP